MKKNRNLGDALDARPGELLNVLALGLVVHIQEDIHQITLWGCN